MSKVTKNGLKMTIVFLTLILLIGLAPSVNAASPKVLIHVSSENVEVGDLVSVTVQAESFPSIRAAQVRLTFNPEFLEVVGAIQKGDIFASGLLIPKVDNAKGEVIIGGTFLGKSEFFSGESGELFSVTLKAVKEGETLLQFLNEGELDGLVIVDAGGKDYKMDSIDVMEARIRVEKKQSQDGSTSSGSENRQDHSNGTDTNHKNNPVSQDQSQPSTLEEYIKDQLKQLEMSKQQELPKSPALFMDVTGHWAKSYIVQLADKKIISGYPDGKFYPDRTITRAEFAKIIVMALGLEERQSSLLDFSDQSKIPDWAKKFVAIAVEKNIITGYTNEKGKKIFAAQRAITRQEMAVMIARALQLNGIKETGTELTFKDEAHIQPWAKNEIALASSLGIISGYPDGQFKPNAFATRGEAAKMIVELLNLLNQTAKEKS